MQVRLAEAELHILALMDSVDVTKHAGEGRTHRLERILADVLAGLKGFDEAAKGFGERAFKRYEPRRTIGYRVTEWRSRRTQRNTR